MIAIRVVAVVCATWLAACADATAPTVFREITETELLVAIDESLALSDAPWGSLPVAAGLFLTVPPSRSPLIAPAVVSDRARRLLADANEILAQCGLHLAPEAVQVVTVPEHLIEVQGNELGSWGGHPPPDVGDPDTFTYDQNERLTAETRELFAYGKRHTSRNAIAVFVVEDIEYYIGEQRTPAAGLSFPPVSHHHADDYPLRNSVLARLTMRDSNRLPLADGRVVAHELGHMLLDTGAHTGGLENLMTNGAHLTPEQCDRMRANRERLFGADAVPDPGRPSGG